MAVHPNDVSPLAQAGAANQAPISPSTTDGEDVKAEDQDAYDRVVIAGMKVMYENEKTKKNITDRLKADIDNPAKTLADTTSMLMIQLEQQANGAIPEGVIWPAAVELLAQMSELAESMDLFPVDDAVRNYAEQLMAVSLGEEYGTQPEEIQELMQSVPPEVLKQIEEEQGNYARKQPSRKVT